MYFLLYENLGNGVFVFIHYIRKKQAMLTKTTEELNHELKCATDAEDFLVVNHDNLLCQDLPTYLGSVLKQKGLTRADVVYGSLLDRKYVYQIFAGTRTPSRDKLIAIGFGLRQSVDEMQKMLKLSLNRELYVRDPRDVLILYSLENNRSIMETNDLLYQHGYPVLGSAI